MHPRSTDAPKIENYVQQLRSRDLLLARDSKHFKQILEIREKVRNLLGPWQSWQPISDLGTIARMTGIEQIVHDRVHEKGRLVGERNHLKAIIDSNLTRPQSRFVLAHEIGHVVLGQMELIDFSISRSCHSDQRQEALCDMFARELLIPQDWIGARMARSIYDCPFVVTLSQECQIPIEYALMRCSDASVRWAEVVKWNITQGIGEMIWAYSGQRLKHRTDRLSQHRKLLGYPQTPSENETSFAIISENSTFTCITVD